MTPPQSSPVRFTRAKTILFSITPAFLLLLLAGIAEVGLRLLADTSSLHLVEPYTYDGQQWLRVNRSYLERYFPANSPLIPELKPTIVHPTKDPNEVRIVCLGESSMFGTPYHYGATTPAILRKQLRHLFPGREITVVNLGASAINSNVIADFVPQTLELQPDVVLIYTGHNEFYGPDGVGASWLQKTFPFLRHAKYTLQDLMLVRILQHWLRVRWLAENPGAEQNLMRQVSEGSHIRAGSADEARIVSTFATNLHDILLFYKREHIPVIVSDIVSNLLFPPFVSDPLPSGAIAAPGSHGIDSLLQLRRADTTNAAINFAIGSWYTTNGETDRGRSYLEQARDDDLLKFRAPSAINTVIHNVCASTETPCVSAVRLFDSVSVGGIPGGDLFWEHLHPRAIGYYHLADLFLKEIFDRRLLPASNPDSAFASRLPFDIGQLSISWLDLALGDISAEAITGRWPFDRYHIQTVVFQSADTVLQHIALEVYSNQRTWNDGILRTAEWFGRHGRLREAQTSYEAILEEYPRAYLVRYLLANLLRDQNKTREAEAQYRSVLQTNPSYAFAHAELGLLLINDGNFADAEQELLRAVDLTEHDPKAPPTLRASAYYGLAAIRANQGQFDKALQFAVASLRIAPSYAAALQLQQKILRVTKR